MFDDATPRPVFAENLWRLRKMTGMTQQQLSQALHLDRSTYAYYETGRTAPNFDTLIRMARIFKVSVDDLIGNAALQDPTVRQPDLISQPNGALALGELPADERAFLAIFRQMGSKQRDALHNYAISLLQDASHKD